MIRVTSIASAVLLAIASPVAAQTTPFFRITHQSEPYHVEFGPRLESSAPLRYTGQRPGPKGGQQLWDVRHLTSGGWNGRAYMRYFRWAGVDGDSPNTGWNMAAPMVRPGAEWPDGPYYLRFRMRTVVPLTEGIRPSAAMKWFLFPTTGRTGRMILYVYRGGGGSGGAGGNDDKHTILQCRAGVSKHMAEVRVPNREWVHVQVGWRWGRKGTAYQRIWLNSNDFARPTDQNADFDEELGGNWPMPPQKEFEELQWGNIVSTGSFTGTDAQIDWMDMELDDEFDPNWAPQKASPAPAAAAVPALPTHTTILSSALLLALFLFRRP